MEEEVEQTEKIPSFINVEPFIEARFKELHALTRLTS